MEKLFTVHITYWLGGGNFYITENKSGLQVGLFFGALRRKVIELLQNEETRQEAFEFVFECEGEPNPIPTFVDHYELRYRKPDMGVVPFLTEKGAMRKSFETGGRRIRETPFGRMDF